MTSTNRAEQVMDNNKRRKRFQPRSKPRGIRLTERDKQIIEAVYLYRVLTTHQIKELLFRDVTRRVAERRLEQLYDHGYLERRPYIRPEQTSALANPNLYLLAKKGNLLLLERGYDETRWQLRDNSVGYEHLEHLLSINTFRIMMTQACSDRGLRLVQWLDDTTLKQDYDKVYIPGQTRAVAVIPDGYFAIDTSHGVTHFFLELDRSNMVTARYLRKLQAYLSYRELAKKRYGTEKFRVLTVTTSKPRLQNLMQTAHKTVSQQDLPRFWFAVLNELSAETVLYEAVWHLAGQDKLLNLLRT